MNFHVNDFAQRADAHSIADELGYRHAQREARIKRLLSRRVGSAGEAFLRGVARAKRHQSRAAFYQTVAESAIRLSSLPRQTARAIMAAFRSSSHCLSAFSKRLSNRPKNKSVARGPSRSARRSAARAKKAWGSDWLPNWMRTKRAFCIAVIVVCYLAEPATRWAWKLNAASNPRFAAITRNLECQKSAMIVDEQGRELGLLRLSRNPDCFGLPMSAPLPPQTARAVARQIYSAEGHADGFLTYNGTSFWDNGRALLFELDRRRLGLSRERAKELLANGRLPTIAPWAGTGTWVTWTEARMALVDVELQIADKISTTLLAMAADAALVAGKRHNRDRLISSTQEVLLIDHKSIGGSIAWRIMFGPTMDSPAPAEICIFAAGWGRMWGPANLTRNRAVARKCIEDAGLPSAEKIAALAFLDGWQMPSGSLPRLSEAERITLSDALPLAPIEARDDGTLTVTLNREVQTAGNAAISAVIDDFTATLGDRLCFKGTCELPVHWGVWLAEAKGDKLSLIGAWTNKHALLLGPLVKNESGELEGRFPSMGLASQHKLLAVLVGIQNSVDSICNRVIDGAIGNASGPPPVEQCLPDGTGWLSLAHAFAISNNNGFVDLAIKLADEIDAMEQSLGLIGDRGVAAQSVLGTGRRAPGPERFLALHAALQRGLRSEPPRTEGLRIFVDGAPRFAVDLTGLDYDDHQWDELRQTIRAPLYEDDGTLWRVQRKLSKYRRIQTTGGKSGSPETTTSKAFARTATVDFTLFQLDGTERHFSLAIVVASSDQTQPIDGIGGSQIAELASAAVFGLGANQLLASKIQTLEEDQ